MALLVAAAAALSACGDSDEPRATATPTPTPTATPEATAEPDTPTDDLAVGITEPNPAFVRPEGEVPPEFARWRDELQQMRPTYYRLSVDWPTNTTPDGATIDLARPNPGCMREIPPCAAFNGVRDQLAALAAAQKAEPGQWQAFVVVSGTPDGLAQPEKGCERAGTLPRNRAPRPNALPRYQEFIVRLLDEAKAVGAELRYWSPWNEPNHPYFIAGQRARCTENARSLAVRDYTRIARAMQETLESYPGEQDLVLGETAGLFERSESYTRAQEFVRELPRELVCAAVAYGQHGYIGGDEPVRPIARALAGHGCPQEHPIWITETGAGRPRSGEERDRSRKALARACRQMHRQLKRWHKDPRVSAAFQYTLREDDRFPTGLVSTELDRGYPALDVWKAWGERERTAPAPPSAC